MFSKNAAIKFIITFTGEVIMSIDDTQDNRLMNSLKQTNPEPQARTQHSVKIKTRLGNKRQVTTALKKGGYHQPNINFWSFEDNPLMSSWFRENEKNRVKGLDEKFSFETKCITHKTEKSKKEITVKKNNQGNYDFEGDWEKLSNFFDLEKESFRNWLTREYALGTITQAAKDLGLRLGEATLSDNGQIQIIAHVNY